MCVSFHKHFNQITNFNNDNPLILNEGEKKYFSNKYISYAIKLIPIHGQESRLAWDFTAPSLKIL